MTSPANIIQYITICNLVCDHCYSVVTGKTQSSGKLGQPRPPLEPNGGFYLSHIPRTLCTNPWENKKKRTVARQSVTSLLCSNDVTMSHASRTPAYSGKYEIIILFFKYKNSIFNVEQEKESIIRVRMSNISRNPDLICPYHLLKSVDCLVSSNDFC